MYFTIMKQQLLSYEEGDLKEEGITLSPEELSAQQKLYEESWNEFELEQFNDEIFRLLLDEPFFSEFSLRLLKFPSSKIPTAAVGFSKASRTFFLMYNPKFIAQLIRTERKGIFIHEFLHLCLDHLTLRSGNHLVDEHNFKIINAGMDCAINSMPILSRILPYGKLIDWGPPRGKDYMFPWMPGKGMMEKALPEQAYEYYVDFIKKNAIPVSGPGAGGELCDDHGVGDPVDGPESILAREKIFNSIKEAARKAEEIKKQTGDHSKGWGSISEAMAATIIELVKSQPPSPEEMLKHFLDSIGRGAPKPTWSKQNRRLPGLRPKRRFKKMPNVAICVDQSGSVDDTMLGYFFHILLKYSSVFDFTYVPFDSNVYKDTIYKVGKYKKPKQQRELCGGTDFNAPTAYVNQQTEYDGMIICTDMYAPLPIPCRVPRLWFTNTEGKQYFEQQGCREPIIALSGL